MGSLIDILRSFSPSPLGGEGWDEGWRREAALGVDHPHPHPLPSRERENEKWTLPSRERENEKWTLPSRERENEKWTLPSREREALHCCDRNECQTAWRSVSCN